MTTFSRRTFLRGAASLLGAHAGTRLLGPLARNAEAAAETSHLVFVYFPGGYNALFGGCANVYAQSGTFDVSANNMKKVGNGVFTDASTFGTLSQFALDHWSALGVRHGQSLHTTPGNSTNGGEYAFTRRGRSSYLTQLAAAMGGTSPLKAALFGGYPSFRVQPASGGVSLQPILDLGQVLKAVGAPTTDSNAPSRDQSAIALSAASEFSTLRKQSNPDSLRSLSDGTEGAIAALSGAPSPTLSLDEIKQAYGAKSNRVGSFASQMAGAEVMIRAVGTNVVSVFASEGVLWDFHQVVGGKSLNGSLSRARFLGQINNGQNYLAPLRTFIGRMLNLPDKNVVVAITGDFVRLPNGGHGDGTVATVLGKYTKQGVNFGCNASSRFNTGNTPDMDGFWAGLASALKVPGKPFGANPYSLV